MSNIICIAGVRYRLEGRLAALNGFFDLTPDEPDGCIEILREPPGAVPAAGSIARHGELGIQRLPDGGWRYTAPRQAAPVQLIASADYRRLRLWLPAWPDAAAQETKAMHLLRTAVEGRLCLTGALSLHAACVEKDGRAVAFTGRSGIGKSTRARIWIEQLGASWISGDRPAIAPNGRETAVYGVPWDGKEQIFRNVCRPLKAILEVRRAGTAWLRRLSPEQARRLLMRQCFLPMWDPGAAAAAMGSIRAAAQSGQLFRLYCGPDADAARTVWRTLYQRPEMILEAQEEMKIRDGFMLRRVMDESIVMPTGDNIAKFDGAVVLNEVSAFVFEALEQPAAYGDVLRMLLNEFDVDVETARTDLDGLLDKFERLGMLDRA